jgi:hypothetical protein
MNLPKRGASVTLAGMRRSRRDACTTNDLRYARTPPNDTLHLQMDLGFRRNLGQCRAPTPQLSPRAVNRHCSGVRCRRLSRLRLVPPPPGTAAAGSRLAILADPCHLALAQQRKTRPKPGSARRGPSLTPRLLRFAAWRTRPRQSELGSWRWSTRPQSSGLRRTDGYFTFHW